MTKNKESEKKGLELLVLSPEEVMAMLDSKGI